MRDLKLDVAATRNLITYLDALDGDVDLEPSMPNTTVPAAATGLPVGDAVASAATLQFPTLRRELAAQDNALVKAALLWIDNVMTAIQGKAFTATDIKALHRIERDADLLRCGKFSTRQFRTLLWRVDSMIVMRERSQASQDLAVQQ